VEWFKKSVLVDDRNSLPYHYLATSFLQLGDVENAVRSLEEEIRISPGNYFAYFRLADLYEHEGREDKLEECYRKLLERDPDNVQAIHRLICHYRRGGSSTDVSFLQRRLVATQKSLNKNELVIWTYHVCLLGQFERAISVLTAKEENASELTIVHLLKAHAYGEMRQFTKKHQELRRFVEKNYGKSEYMKNELKEFADVFGADAGARIEESLNSADTDSLQQ
jgi:tetratricopeptide (TPR) repeat protein